MSGEPSAAEFLEQVRSRFGPSDPFRLSIESIRPLTPEEVRRHLPLLIALARAKEA